MSDPGSVRFKSATVQYSRQEEARSQLRDVVHLRCRAVEHKPCLEIEPRKLRDKVQQSSGAHGKAEASECDDQCASVPGKTICTSPICALHSSACCTGPRVPGAAPADVGLDGVTSAGLVNFTFTVSEVLSVATRATCYESLAASASSTLQVSATSSGCTGPSKAHRGR